MKTYQFCGTAMVTVQCFVEAASVEEARAKVETGDCIWECDMVDGDVGNIWCAEEEEDEEEEDEDADQEA